VDRIFHISVIIILYGAMLDIIAWHFTARLQTSPDIFTERRGIMYVSEIYGLGKVKLKIKWPGRLEKTQI
jgi:hypothetical protein